MISYGTVFILMKPVIGFVTSSIDMFLLTKPPKFAFDDNQKVDLKTANGVEEVKSSEINYPAPGQKYGQIIVADLALDVPLFFGDSPEILRHGAGHYTGSIFPGEMGTTLIGDHNGNQFGKLVGADFGMIVEVKTTYGTYQFKVDTKEIKDKDDSMVTGLLNQNEQRLLVLYTCYPVDSIGMTKDRLFVVCSYYSGPIVNEKE